MLPKIAIKSASFMEIGIFLADPGRRFIPGIDRQAQLMCDRVTEHRFQSLLCSFNFILVQRKVSP